MPLRWGHGAELIELEGLSVAADALLTEDRASRRVIHHDRDGRSQHDRRQRHQCQRRQDHILRPTPDPIQTMFAQILFSVDFNFLINSGRIHNHFSPHMLINFSVQPAFAATISVCTACSGRCFGSFFSHRIPMVSSFAIRSSVRTAQLFSGFWRVYRCRLTQFPRL